MWKSIAKPRSIAYFPRLFRASSTQGASSLINWREWTPRVFEKAQQDNKPIFISSVSDSQWCTLMAQESFADPQIANVLNSDYVPIRIHKDEQRGIDKSLMMFLQLKAQGRGGWPLNIVLTPSRFEPFIAASYLSTDNFKQFLEAGSSVWRESPQICDKMGSDFVQQLKQFRDGAHGNQTQIDVKDALEQAKLQYEALSDQSPRFVMGYALSLLDADLRSSVLRSIAQGGMVDQLSGGVYAYSISSDWGFPSFQKTLNGQATLLMACAAHLKAQPEDQVVRELAENIVRFTSELAPRTSVASSSTDMFTYAEFNTAVKSHFGLVERDIAQMLWGVNEQGNVNPDLDPLKACVGQNVLSRHKANDEVARTFGVPAERVETTFQTSKQLLAEYKEHHKPQPVYNDRVVLSDLGLMVSGLAQISPFVPSAVPLATKWAKKVRDPYTTLKEITIPASCDDFAFLIMGLLDFHKYVAPQTLQWVDAAHQWQLEQSERFEDKVNGGFFFAEDVPNLFFRAKYTYDAADPNYNGVSARNLARLAKLGYSEHAARAQVTKDLGVHGVLSSPLSHVSFLHQ